MFRSWMERTRRGAALRRVLPVPLAAALAALALAVHASPARASHYNPTVGEYGNICYNCHNLSTGESEPNTYSIWKNTPNLTNMKTANGGAVPDEFGCTYCHSNAVNSQMKGVIGHFVDKRSMHPVGWDFTAVSNNNTSHEYTSSFRTNYQNELDCVDCHDVNLLDDPTNSNYLDHVALGDPLRANNPFMLRGGITAADSYDELCRLCHGNAAGPVNGINDSNHNVQLTAASAHGDGVPAGSGGSGYLIESDGTAIRAADANGDGSPDAGATDQCTKCHDTHYSNNEKLFNDGHEGDASIDVGTNCTGVCHYPGDATHLPSGNFNVNGHGKATSFKGTSMAFGCTNCHSVNTLHDSPYADSRAAKMLLFQPDANLSVYGKSKNSICTVCHSSYVAHKNGPNAVGCLDCHDEHAEGTGDAKAGNLAMIPKRLPNGGKDREAVVFEKAAADWYDYYRASGDGVCDNAICHKGVSTPAKAAVAPLAEFMKNKRHLGGDRKAGSNCRECHEHNAKAPVKAKKSQ